MLFAGGTRALAATGAAEAANIADQLLHERQLTAGRRGGAGRRGDVLAVGHGLVADILDHALVVEVDDVDLLIEHRRRKEGDLLDLAADVVPDIVVEGAGARRAAE